MKLAEAEITGGGGCDGCQTPDGTIRDLLLKQSAPSQQAGFTCRSARANEVVIFRGERSEHLFGLCDGWAFRFMQLSDGRRQIIEFILPGEIISCLSAHPEEEPFSVQALTEICLWISDRGPIADMLTPHSPISRVWDKECAKIRAAAGEFLLAIGRLSAEERIAFLLVHLIGRLSSTSAPSERHYPIPLRQQHIADALGLTPVHVSRVLGRFRELNICRLASGVLEVLDMTRLQRIGSLK